MKCKQKVCNRNKNICYSGNCNVCDEAIKKVLKSKDKDKNKKPVEEVLVNIESMVTMHEKLMRGERVDPNDVSTLLLAGIIKIINQHDLIDNLEEKVNEKESETLSKKFRIESLENWVINQGESISCLDKKLELEIKELKEKELGKASNVQNIILQDEPKNTIKCKECGKTFSKNHQLEEHMVEHSNVERFKCESCNKDFYLKWRLQKHMKVHSEMTKV